MARGHVSQKRTCHIDPANRDRLPPSTTALWCCATCKQHLPKPTCSPPSFSVPGSSGHARRITVPRLTRPAGPSTLTGRGGAAPAAWPRPTPPPLCVPAADGADPQHYTASADEACWSRKVDWKRRCCACRLATSLCPNDSRKIATIHHTTYSTHSTMGTAANMATEPVLYLRTARHMYGRVCVRQCSSGVRQATSTAGQEYASATSGPGGKYRERAAGVRQGHGPSAVELSSECVGCGNTCVIRALRRCRPAPPYLIPWASAGHCFPVPAPNTYTHSRTA